MTDQILTDNHHDNTSWADVLLRPRINNAVAGKINRSGKYLGRHIRNQRHIPCIRLEMELHTVNRFIRTHMDISSLPCQLPLVLIRHRCKPLTFR